MVTTKSIQRTARFAGAAYFIIIITSVLNLIFGPYQLMVEGDIASTIGKIASNQALYRIGMAYEILMYMGVIFLSVALYHLLKIVNKPGALAALLFRFGEAIMGVLTVIGSMITLFLINGEFSQETTQTTVAVILEIQEALMSVLMVFIGIGSIIFCFLFFISRFIPRWLSVFGMIAFSFVLLESLVLLLYPMNPWVFPGVIAVVFEIVIGLWLMIKGVRIENYGFYNQSVC